MEKKLVVEVAEMINVETQCSAGSGQKELVDRSVSPFKLKVCLNLIHAKMFNSRVRIILMHY